MRFEQETLDVLRKQFPNSYGRQVHTVMNWMQAFRDDPKSIKVWHDVSRFDYVNLISTKKSTIEVHGGYLKHVIERWGAVNGLESYVCQDALIYAVISKGIYYSITAKNVRMKSVEGLPHHSAEIVFHDIHGGIK